MYASFQSYSDSPQWISRSVSNVEAQLKKGFEQIKVKIGGTSFKEDVRHINALQHTAGSSITMILDANQSYDAAAAFKWERYSPNGRTLAGLRSLCPLISRRITLCFEAVCLFLLPAEKI